MKNQKIRDIVKVFAVGCAAMLLALTAEFFAYMSVVLFCKIPYISGYMAVCGLAGALIALIGAVGIIYMCGAWMVRKGKFTR